MNEHLRLFLKELEDIPSDKVNLRRLQSLMMLKNDGLFYNYSAEALQGYGPSIENLPFDWIYLNNLTVCYDIQPLYSIYNQNPTAHRLRKFYIKENDYVYNRRYVYGHSI